MPSYTVILREDPETPGVLLADVPALPGCHTFGHSRDEALEMARDAITLYLETLKDEGKEPPPDVVAEAVAIFA